ncbi:MAG TPA: hypothetical protein VJ998_10110 [Pseudomonadales bacterium]|nr:hypothetical protein [Pseudomonadales bacterium]
MKDREETIAFEMNYCQHYNTRTKDGISITCNKGMDIKSIRLPRDEKTGQFGQPCLGGHLLDDVHSVCPHWIRRTREQGEARADRMEKFILNMTLIGPVVAEWREKPPIGKQEVIECPACGGKLHLAQAASNGHVWGKCETADCVSWME